MFGTPSTNDIFNNSTRGDLSPDSKELFDDLDAAICFETPKQQPKEEQQQNDMDESERLARELMHVCTATDFANAHASPSFAVFFS